MKGSVFTLRGRTHLLKTLRNVRVTLLCGLLTFVVLRSSLGAGKFGTPVQDFDEIRHHLHSFKLRRQYKLLLRKELTDTAPYKDTSRSTLSLPTEEDYRGAGLTTADNAVHQWTFNNKGFLHERFEQRSPSHRPRILLVTGSLNSCTRAIEAQFLLKLLKNKMDYCHLHGIEFFHGVEGACTSTPTRAHYLQELMLLHQNVEWIWWMDSLAMFTNILSHPSLEGYAGYNVVRGSRGSLSSKVMVLDAWEKLWTGGSFLLRNCEWSRNFLESAGRMQTREFFVDTRMEMYEPGVGDGEAWPLVTHFGSCSLCGKENTDLSCLVQMERAFDFADSQ